MPELTLARKTNEALLIGDDIVVKVVRIRHGEVRLRICAPAEVRILRQELAQRDSEEG